ncbi:MAG: ComF family protein [Chloroflexi bacterium]|nr:MAG: ComF family protein [Chloroflexota bacterium]
MPIPTVRQLLHDALDAVLPQRCVVCGRFGAALHLDCRASLPRAQPPRCERCWSPGDRLLCDSCVTSAPAYAGLRAGYCFTGPVRRAILEAKFRGMTTLLPPLAAEAALSVPSAWAVDLVVPIPLHPNRQRQRGYNQAAIAAREVARVLGVPYGEPLRRVRATPAQAGLDALQRQRNIRGAFAAISGPGAPVVASFAGSVVLLVDDVSTTGATFAEVARALLDAGVARVYALSMARED